MEVHGREAFSDRLWTRLIFFYIAQIFFTINEITMVQLDLIKKLSDDVHLFCQQEDPSKRVLNLFLLNWFNEAKMSLREECPLLLEVKKEESFNPISDFMEQ